MGKNQFFYLQDCFLLIQLSIAKDECLYGISRVISRVVSELVISGVISRVVSELVISGVISLLVISYE